MSIWKRVITLVVVFMVLLSCLVSPASADTVDNNVVNLMSPDNSYSYELISGESFVNHIYYGYAKQMTEGNMNWFLSVPTLVDWVYFTIEVGEYGTPSIRFRINGIDKPFEILGRDGRYIFIKGAPQGTPISSIDISLSFGVPYTGMVTLISAYGTLNDAYSFSSAMVYTQDLVYFADLDELRRVSYENKKATSLPMKPFNHVTEWTGEPTDPLLNGIVWIYNDYQDMPFVMADRLVYTVSTCGSVGSEGFSFFLMDAAGTILETLPADYIYSVERNVDRYFGSSSMQWPIYKYTITVDVSGIDLSDYYVFGLNFWIDPVDIYYDEWTGWFCHLHSIVASPYLEKEPWYARFGHWINNGFDRVVDALGGGDKSNSLSNAGQQMKEDAGAISSAGDSLGAVSQPDVDSGALINNYVNFDPVGLSVLSCITSNPMVTGMLVVVFTFCLAGYIFFGKKR